ncbi:MAG: type II toxin-antitoxin system HicB family antitoxin [Opitutales bacterium]|jgi:predicted RNase H-like HicB family nuclease
MDKQYTYTVRIEEQDGGFLVEVPALQGCHTWGKTYEEAVANAEEAIQAYLEALSKLGKPIPIESRHAELHLNIHRPVAV